MQTLNDSLKNLTFQNTGVLYLEVKEWIKGKLIIQWNMY